MEDLPPVPLHGTANAPLPELLAWHAEVLAADREHAASAAATAAAFERRRVAFKRFVALIGIYRDDRNALQAGEASADTPKAVDKGEGKARASAGGSDAEDEMADENDELESEMDVSS
jgi:hypothetical protein